MPWFQKGVFKIGVTVASGQWCTSKLVCKPLPSLDSTGRTILSLSVQG